jgi:SRSO17 transposase
LAPKPWSGRGRPTSWTRRDREHQPVQAKTLALGLPQQRRLTAWETITRREGSADWLTSRYARVRVRAAHRDERLAQPRADEWLLVEWPEGESDPTKYWLATLPEDIPFDLVDLAKLRWRIERDYQELKQELGLGHYEGRGWRGFHHHATLYIAAYGFLISEREAFPPQDQVPPRSSRNLPFPMVTDPDRVPRSAPRDAADPALNDTSRTRSQPCADASPSPSPRASTDARAAPPRASRRTSSSFMTQ